MHIVDQLQDVRGQLDYLIKVLNAGNLEQWEAREYAGLQLDYLARIADLEIQVNNYYAARGITYAA